MSVRFYLRSEVMIEDIEYFLELKEWTAEGLKLLFNFTNPLLISQG